MSTMYTLTNEPTEVIGRKPIKTHFTIMAMLVFGMVVLFYYNYKKFGNIFQRTEFSYILTYSVMFMAILYFVVQVLDRSIQLVINKNGFWIKGKGQFAWNQFSRYYTKRANKQLQLRAKHIDKEGELIIDINSYDVAGDKIRSAFQYYASLEGIVKS